MANPLYTLETKKQRLSLYDNHFTLEWLKKGQVIERKEIRYLAMKEFYLVDGSNTLMLYPKNQRIMGYGYEKKDRFLLPEINRFLLGKIAYDPDAKYVLYSTRWLQKMYICEDHLRIIDIRYDKERNPRFVELTIQYEKIADVLMENSRKKRAWIFRGKHGLKGFEYAWSDVNPRELLLEAFTYINERL